MKENIIQKLTSKDDIVIDRTSTAEETVGSAKIDPE